MEMKGTGTAITLEAAPVKIKLGPVLPYNSKAFALLEISNPSKYSTEIISYDFDKKFKDDLELLAAYE
jgi:hypothetical protein